MSDLTALDAQLAEMERSLMADPNTPDQVRAYLHLRAARTLLSGQGNQSQSDPNDRRSALAPSRGAGKIVRRIDPDRMTVLEHVANVIRGRSEPTKTADIFEELPLQIRSLIKGAEPRGNLSAMLFHSPAFISHGRQGWVLRAQDDDDEVDAGEEAEDETDEEDIG